MKKPNIIFYFSDQQRWDTLGCYGQRLDVTPNLDRLAREGTRFANSFTCQPVCGPARAALQTGVYPTAVGCHTNARPLPLDADTLARRMGAAGYSTAYIGKWHLASGNGDGDPHCETTAIPEEYRGGYKDYWMASDVLEFTSHGYNGWMHDGNNKKVEFVGYRAECVNDFAVDFIHNYSDERPFFLFISQIEPHHQNDHARFEGPDGSKRRFAGYDVPGDLAGTDGDWRENYPDYLGCCNALDTAVGKLCDALKEKGIYDDTTIIYTSDHGSHFCTRNTEYKRSCHDGCIRTPLIARGPGFPVNKVYEHPVSLIDLPATLLDLAGEDVPEHYDGVSLLPIVSGDEEYPEDEVFLQISESQVGRAIRDARWTYSVRADADGWKDSCADIYYEDYLYDNIRDPHQKTNLVTDPEYAEERANLSGRLIRRMILACEKAPEIRPAKTNA